MIYFYFKTFKYRTEDINPDDFIIKDYPFVTIQLPLYNEKYVICRLIDAALRIDYPKDKLEIQILDDSTDDTKEIIENHIKPYIEQGFIVNHVHRTNRQGYKAGALKED
jgi:cellulose synthase/poly-beta-1,6-N-acetylglucosamine synthase-like glycosyltransferase